MQPDFLSDQSAQTTLHPSQGQIDSFALLLHRMINRIRQSLELLEILTTTVAEVRAFLKTDRVKIYRFHEDGSGEVIAEAIYDRRLPSLLGHSFPAEDIPPEARRMFLECRQRSIVDVVSQTIGESPLEQGGSEIKNKIHFRTVDPCHVEYLTAMGVRSSLVVPILDKHQLWGLLVSHHSTPRQMTERELQVVQIVADQVSIAIAQANLLQQARTQAAQESTINRVTSLLHAMPKMQLREALKQTVVALQGVGGRIYIMPHLPHQTPQVVTYGNQPGLSDLQHNDKNDEIEKEIRIPKPKVKNSRSFSTPSGSVSPHPLEQHHHWQTWLDMEEPVNLESNIWMIADLYRAVMPSDLSVAFLKAQVRGLLIAQLQYRQKPLGYLTVFRQEIDVERIWAGQPDRDDPRQRRPRESFETWRELKRGQAHPWTTKDCDLIQALSSHFAVAIHQRSLYQQVCALNIDLEKDIQKRKQAERKISTLNAQLEQRVLERTSELQTANEALLLPVRSFLNEVSQLG